MTQVGSIDFEDTFQHTGNGAFVQGRTRLSRDGSLLMVSVTGGVRFVRMYAPLAASNISMRMTAGSERLIRLKGSIGNGDTLAYSLSSQPAHGTAIATGDIVSYTPAPGFKGKDSFRYRVRYGRATVEAVVSILVMPTL